MFQLDLVVMQVVQTMTTVGTVVDHILGTQVLSTLMVVEVVVMEITATT